ncbi:hypothetical protein BKA62DRAFT_724158 [Auriculariales sp. MPI-PUGE-AT-0066]|nr:hypothetical protein BKA62DRAFT_724158 [Auriculariales sp. MPI-PUGE-AT-0066]
MQLLALSLFLLPTVVFARISSVKPYPGTYHATRNSKFPLTFNTIVTPTNNLDFSVAVGLGPAGKATGTALGEEFIQNFDLVALGHASTGQGNFTLHVKLPASKFEVFGDGKFTLTAIATAAYGASYGTQLEPYRVDFNAVIKA